MVEKIFVREYLESLKEDSELDFIFTLLVESMGFQIVKTPIKSKGQSQYGKDTIAIGPDQSGKKYRWYFEIKGYDDRDVDQRTFNKPDGLKDSFTEAKYALFEANGIPSFNDLPIKIVLVHNGETKENFRPTFEGYIKTEFEPGGFEDWDINRLTELFTQYLFSEYLLADPISARLFKRVLVFLSEPEYGLADLDPLIKHLFETYEKNILIIKSSKSKKRLREKLLATINLLAVVIVHYCSEENNLYPAKNALSLIVLRTWYFILLKKSENDKKFLLYFNKLLYTQRNLLANYFNKTFPVALTTNGLFSSEGFAFESIGFPLRCFEYVDSLIYTYQLDNYFKKTSEELFKSRFLQKQQIKSIISKNSGCSRPILDIHLIPILHIVLFFANKDIDEDDVYFLCGFFRDCLHNIIIRKNSKGVFPLSNFDYDKLIELEISGKKPDGFLDSPSLLITVLFEMAAIFQADEIYSSGRTFFLDHPDLQTAYPLNEDNFEIEIFSGNINEQYWVETSIFLIESKDVFRKQIIEKINNRQRIRNEEVNYGFLRLLAESYFQNTPHPDEWRNLTQWLI